MKFNLFVLCCALILFGSFPAHAQEAAAAKEAGFAGTQTCMGCHQSVRADKVMPIFQTHHGQVGDSRTPMGGKGCESCHGPSASHAAAPTQVAPAVVFGQDSERASTAELQSQSCLGCHTKGHINWQGSTHATEDVACTSCHKVHERKDPVRDRASQAKVCFGCHVGKRMDANKPFRHALHEGEMACSSCHNPHGSNGPSMLRKHSTNETCYTCHAEKRGPFIAEHEPVQDDCTNCHDPHGSVNERMLKVRQPFLCQQCHVASRHVGTNYDQAQLDGRSSRMIGNSCTNCHSQIHGSNHPGGNTFRR